MRVARCSRKTRRSDTLFRNPEQSIMDHEALRIFVRVADLGSFSRAGEQLGMDVPAEGGPALCGWQVCWGGVLTAFAEAGGGVVGPGLAGVEDFQVEQPGRRVGEPGLSVLDEF